MASEGVLQDYYLKREELIRLEKADPFNYGSDWHNTTGLFRHWKDADEALEDPKVDIVYIFGGNQRRKNHNIFLSDILVKENEIQYLVSKYTSFIDLLSDL